MDYGDFARYVIGDHSDWLSLRLNEEPWRSADVRLTELVATFNAEERFAWEEYKEADERFSPQRYVRLVFGDRANDQSELLETQLPDLDSEIAAAEEERKVTLERLRKTLRRNSLAEFDEILEQKISESRRTRAHFIRLEPHPKICRVARVRLGLDCGEAFGEFDEIRSNGCRLIERRLKLSVSARNTSGSRFTRFSRTPPTTTNI